VRYGSWGFGLGESGIFVALGLLPAIGNFYAQAGSVTAMALWSGAPFALLTSLIFIAYTLLNYRRDWLIRKQTLAVGLGLGRAIDFSTVILIGAYAFILLAAVVSGLPLRILLALLGLPIVSGAYSRLDRETLPQTQGMRLYTSAIHASLVTALLYSLALITDKLW
jgi:1,4-dihydroxy-2-naphthoate octaprenyltransferase